jgi:hypothetical protein
VDEGPDQFRRADVVEPTPQALAQQTVWATAQLLGHDHARMGPPGSLPLLMERSEITNIERDNGPAFCRCQGELFLVGSGVLACFFVRQDVVTAAGQVGGQPGQDFAVEVKPHEQSEAALRKETEGERNVDDALGLVHAILDHQRREDPDVFLDSQADEVLEGFAEI